MIISRTKRLSAINLFAAFLHVFSRIGSRIVIFVKKYLKKLMQLHVTVETKPFICKGSGL